MEECNKSFSHEKNTNIFEKDSALMIFNNNILNLLKKKLHIFNFELLNTLRCPFEFLSRLYIA